jgi:hypothetical protein
MHAGVLARAVSTKRREEITMSERAYERFMASYLLNPEESLPQNKQEIIDLTEEVLDAKGIECDEKIDKMAEEDIRNSRRGQKAKRENQGKAQKAIRFRVREGRRTRARARNSCN